jgi:hypothetical protein
MIKKSINKYHKMIKKYNLKINKVLANNYIILL